MDKEDVIVLVGILLIIGLIVWVVVAAPCQVFQFTHEVPGRCLNTFKG